MTDQDTLNPDDDKVLKLEDRTPLVISFSESIAEKHYEENAERVNDYINDVIAQDIEFHSTVSGSVNDGEIEGSISLDKCVELFTVAEQLGEEDPWYFFIFLCPFIAFLGIALGVKNFNKQQRNSICGNCRQFWLST